MSDREKLLLEHLTFIYGSDQAHEVHARLLQMIRAFRAQYPKLSSGEARTLLSERDAILITYGDMVQQVGQKPLRTLGDFLRRYLKGVVSGVHLLPFFPYSSDDGFAVIDYRRVDPRLGDWEDIHRLGQDFRLMFDAVINHISSQSAAFQGFLRGDPAFEDFFIVIPPGTDLSAVFRPRSSPVLTPFETPNGEKLVWTTFGPDQIDLNYANPAVLLEAIAILLFYAAQGAEFIRLDAATFLWKETGTSCANLPRTHRIIQLMRTVLDMTAPRVALITETNVPHKENIAYFGDGTNEAQMVYNFAFPVLTLHAFQRGDASTLTDWATSLRLPSSQVTFFNFLASHDGIGLTPARDLLPEEEIRFLVERARALGGYVSFRRKPDGSQSPYELNINYLDALRNPAAGDESPSRLASRFLASQAIMLALRGVPGIYFHSLFGSRNWHEGVEQTGRYRTINRQKLTLTALEDELANPASLRARVFHGYRRLLQVRRRHPAFNPHGEQRVHRLHPAVFAVERHTPGDTEQMLCLTNITAREVEFPLPDLQTRYQDILGNNRKEINGSCRLRPYQTRWLKRV